MLLYQTPRNTTAPMKRWLDEDEEMAAPANTRGKNLNIQINRSPKVSPQVSPAPAAI